MLLLFGVLPRLLIGPCSRMEVGAHIEMRVLHRSRCPSAIYRPKPRRMGIPHQAQKPVGHRLIYILHIRLSDAGYHRSLQCFYKIRSPQIGLSWRPIRVPSGFEDDLAICSDRCCAHPCGSDVGRRFNLLQRLVLCAHDLRQQCLNGETRCYVRHFIDVTIREDII